MASRRPRGPLHSGRVTSTLIFSGWRASSCVFLLINPGIYHSFSHVVNGRFTIKTRANEISPATGTISNAGTDFKENYSIKAPSPPGPKINSYLLVEVRVLLFAKTVSAAIFDSIKNSHLSLSRAFFWTFLFGGGKDYSIGAFVGEMSKITNQRQHISLQ